MIRGLMLASLCWMTTQVACAADLLSACPSIKMLKKFAGTEILVLPTAYDPQTHITKMAVWQTRIFTGWENVFSGLGKFKFVISPIDAVFGEHSDDILQKAQYLLNDMQLDTEEPLIVDTKDNRSVAICAYSLPGMETKAFIMQYSL